MKKTYDYFIEYYEAISSDDDYSSDVEVGIFAYLDSIELIDYKADDDAHEKIARRELARFKLMPLGTFVIFFENFNIREKLMVVLKESRLLALQRLTFEKTITEEIYRTEMARFYSIAESIASDSRYSGWLKNVSRKVAEHLRFAMGTTERIPDGFKEFIQYSQETEGF